MHISDVMYLQTMQFKEKMEELMFIVGTHCTYVSTKTVYAPSSLVVQLQ